MTEKNGQIPSAQFMEPLQYLAPADELTGSVSAYRKKLNTVSNLSEYPV